MFSFHKKNQLNDVPNAYKELIEKCWSQEAKDRPSFDQIVKELKTNPEFITEDVNQDEFYDYVDYIDNYKSTFDITKGVIHFKDFIQEKGRNKNVKPILFETFSEETTKEISDNKNDNSNDTRSESKKSNQLIDAKTIEEKMSKEAHTNETKPLKIEEIEEKKVIEIDTTKKNILNYPLKKFNELSKMNQKLVEEAEKDSEKQFEVGHFLIEGKNDFPKDVTLGLQYINHSINGKCTNAIVYYVQLLIKGKIIPEDLSKAEEYLSKLNATNDKRKYLLLGLMSYKKNKFTEAVKWFQEGSKLGDSKFMYKYGIMLFIGEGTKLNTKEAIKSLINSKDQGYDKSGHFLTSLNALNKNKSFSKLRSESQLIFVKNNIKNVQNSQTKNVVKTESQFNQIVLQPKKTEKLFFNKTLKSSIFRDCLNL